jgi:hypothetical protein
MTGGHCRREERTGGQNDRRTERLEDKRTGGQNDTSSRQERREESHKGWLLGMFGYL